MSQIRAHSLPRTLYRRVRAHRRASEENRFATNLRHDPQAPALVLSPHWDDAVFDCWTLLASGDEVKVVNVFAGAPEPGSVTLWDSITGALDSSERARERLAEDALALALAKREPLNLPFLDAQYRQAPGPTLAQLDRALTGPVASASRAYVPAGLGSHPDHLLARRYGRMLARAGIPVALYAELPYCVMHGWPHWVDGREGDPHRNVDAYWQSFLAAVPEMPQLRSAHVERLDAAAAAAKLAAMRCYRTQFAALDAGARELLSDPAIHGFEVRWELACGGATEVGQPL